MCKKKISPKLVFLIINFVSLVIPVSVWCSQNLPLKEKLDEFSKFANFNKSSSNSPSKSNVKRFNQNTFEPYLANTNLSYLLNQNTQPSDEHTKPALPGIQPEQSWFQKYIKPYFGADWQSFETIGGVILLLLLLFGLIWGLSVDYGLRGALSTILVMGSLFGAVSLITWFLIILLVYIFREASKTNAIIIFCFISLLFGAVFYVFRSWKRAWYGVSEIIIALFLCGFTIYKISDYKSRNASDLAGLDILGIFIALGSSSYIIVRGFDNIGWDNLGNIWKNLRNIFRRKPPVQSTDNEQEQDNSVSK
jgi:hypothetical protein